MKKKILLIVLICIHISLYAEKKLHVVTTLTDYAYIAKKIGGERVKVKALVYGNQDAHYIRPKPSFVSLARQADVFITTGLDIELWVPTVINNSGNNKIRSGQRGFVAAAWGVKLRDKPKIFSRSEGGLHIYGNPHITSGPLNIRVVAYNIACGLTKNDPANKRYYFKRLKQFQKELDICMYGKKLVWLLGGKILFKLAIRGRLISFLKRKKFRGKKLIRFLGGWMKKMLPLRGKEIISYHENWCYFFHFFGLHKINTIEPKPGIAPTPSHLRQLIKTMKRRKIKAILCANYFDENKIRSIAQKTNATPVIVPLYVHGKPGIKTYFQLVDLWINSLLEAYK